MRYKGRMKNLLPPIVVHTREDYHKTNASQFFWNLAAIWLLIVPGINLGITQDVRWLLLTLSGAVIVVGYGFRPLKATYWPKGFG